MYYNNGVNMTYYQQDELLEELKQSMTLDDLKRILADVINNLPIHEYDED